MFFIIGEREMIQYTLIYVRKLENTKILNEKKFTIMVFTFRVFQLQS